MITDDIIYLRAPEPADLPTMYAVENDRSLWYCNAVRAPMSMYKIREFVESYNANLLATDSGRFTICRRADDAVLGFIDYFELDTLNRRTGIGLVILEEFRGQGYGSRSLELLAGYLDKELGLHSLWAIVAQDNKASRATFEAARFFSSGNLRSWIRIGGSYADALIYQRLLQN